MTPTLRAYGDAGLLVTWTTGTDGQRWRAAQALAERLTGADGVRDLVATYDAVLVTFDPVVDDHETLSAVVRDRLGVAGSDLVAPRSFTVPVFYGGEHGPDLDDVAIDLGLTPEDVVARHTAAAWTVRFRASPAGAPFLEGPTWPRPVARADQPRVRLAAGSVALSGQQTMVYPVVSPGGWRVIGRTPLRLVDPAGDDLGAYRPGDVFRFRAVDAGETVPGERLGPS